MGRDFAACGVQAFWAQSGKVPFNKADGGVQSDLLTFFASVTSRAHLTDALWEGSPGCSFIG